VLITGESGAGKEVIARIIHGGQKRRAPFVAVNLAAVPEALFESELFGHQRGSFTGATSERTGAFRDAADGVLFLDEVGELRLDLQVKLLRAIDQKRVRPVGGREEYPAPARVVTATNVDLRDAAAKGFFRLDLYHRLAGILIHVPPLRDRRDEIPPLACALLARQAPQVTLSADAAERLALGHWAGNVRELAHALGQASLKALSFGRAEIACSDLPDSTQVDPHTSPTAESVQQVMRSTGGNATRAAQALGISRATLYNLLRRWGLNPRELRAGAAREHVGQ
jgi:DNA-binding NtrC family response regulator